MEQQDNSEPSAAEQIERLTRRAMLLMFAAGVIAVPLLWAMEASDGTIEPFDRIAYPTLIFIFGASLLLLWRRPGLIEFARWIGFSTITGMLLLTFWVQMGRPVSIASNYNVVTVLGWLPLAYIIAFLMLKAREAFVAATGIFVFFTYFAFSRGMASTEYAAQDRSLMVNTLVSHAVLLACLMVLLWLRFMIGVQGEQTTRLSLLAFTDPLTGLANRRWTLRQIEELVDRSRPDFGAAVVLGDLDFFKRINDSHGHAIGDRVLISVSDALRSATRDGDLVARWGGEEFLVLFRSTRAGEALELAERLRGRIEELIILDELQHRVPVTMSMGVAVLSAGESSASWVRRADDALYRAKDAGRNCCVLATA